MKKDEFRTLKQGGRTLKEYMDDLCALSRYAPEDIDTDAKRRDKFLNGLKGDLKILLSVAYAPNYQTLLDQAITLDNNIRKEENRKRKFNSNKNHTEFSHKKHHSSEGSGSCSFHRHGDHCNKSNGHNFNGHNSNGHKSNGGYKSNPSFGHHNGHHNGHRNGHGNGNNGQRQSKSDGKRDLSGVMCYKCKKYGHYSSNCPELKTSDTTKPNPFQKGYVNHLDVEEVMNEPDAVIEIGLHKFPTHLVVLPSHGFDVILGMDYMIAYGGVIDCANRAITLTTPEGKKIRYKSRLEPKDIKLNYLKGVSLNHLKEVSLDQVAILREYLDVFPEELPGMPPDRDVEFFIDLLPGTGPISKRPYPISTDELKELKKQLEEQLHSGFVRESSSP
ncbi:uncharacterized protein [Lolium perenne]|uniref:uncharacterized protein n=1 Tax=Lolium perenne TaxID=4522 RepID=UPI003A99841D